MRATRDCTLLALERDQFIGAVTGHRRSHEAVGSVIGERLKSPFAAAPARD